MDEADDAPELIPAACYARRSTGLQYYSVEHQLAVIADYARARGFSIVRTFTDDRSGLTLAGRPGLRALLGEALGGDALFRAILVYDISRWGRFQDLDQAAHYEFLCRKAGIAVEYCNEPFDNDGSPQSNLLKQIKRSIAAEYSRDLSQRLTRAKHEVAAKGFYTGGTAPFALRRMVLDPKGRPKAVLEYGEKKLLAGYRSILVLGPASEQRTVQAIFDWYVNDGLSRQEIIRRLNRRAIPRRAGQPWSDRAVRTILTNSIYVGDLVFGRTTAPLGVPRTQTPPETWLRLSNIVPAIIDRALFDEAQKRPRDPCKASNEALLEDLINLLAEHGRLSRRLLASQPHMAPLRTYERRFGSLQAAFLAAGHVLHKHARLKIDHDH